MTCPACDPSVDKGIKCKECKIWMHYYCTKLPDYYLVLLITKQNLTYYFETCVVDKCPQFVTDQAKIKSAIESQRLARSAISEDSDNQLTPPGTTNSTSKMCMTTIHIVLARMKLMDCLVKMVVM